jgi:hypothetical protein
MGKLCRPTCFADNGKEFNMPRKKSDIKMQLLCFHCPIEERMDKFCQVLDQLVYTSPPVERSDEMITHRGHETYLTAVLVPGLVAKARQLSADHKVKLEHQAEYHRVPFGYICDELKKEGWILRSKLVNNYGLARELWLFTKNGRTRVLDHATFQLYQLGRVDMEHLKEKHGGETKGRGDSASVHASADPPAQVPQRQDRKIPRSKT